jgi:hypothetical protein
MGYGRKEGLFSLTLLVIQAEIITYLPMVFFQNWWSLFHCRDLMLEKSIPLAMPSEILKISDP